MSNLNSIFFQVIKFYKVNDHQLCHIRLKLLYDSNNNTFVT